MLTRSPLQRQVIAQLTVLGLEARKKRQRGGPSLWYRQVAGPQEARLRGTLCEIPNRMPAERAAVIASMRRRRMSSPGTAFSLSLPLSSVRLELRRLGLNRKNQECVVCEDAGCKAASIFSQRRTNIHMTTSRGMIKISPAPVKASKS